MQLCIFGTGGGVSIVPKLYENGSVALARPWQEFDYAGGL
jgi:hypothetical protein